MQGMMCTVFNNNPGADAFFRVNKFSVSPICPSYVNPNAKATQSYHIMSKMFDPAAQEVPNTFVCAWIDLHGCCNSFT